jgi:NAD+ synthase (glutamine-hydrolysing)
LRIALAQLNPTIGDFRGNAMRIHDAWTRGREKGADLVVCPELAIPGYPPRDLLESRAFVDRNLESLQELAATTHDGPGLVVGFVDRNPSSEGNPLHNAAALIDGGKVQSVHHKALLPTYDVFDEARHFEPAREVHCARFRGRPIAITICEDMWTEGSWAPGRRYGQDPIEELLRGAPTLLVNISASPWNAGKHAVREELLAAHARRANLRMVFVNQVGGQDDLVFDGASTVIARNGDTIARGAEFEEDLLVFDEDDRCGDVRPVPAGRAAETERIYRALVLGLRDYFRKAGGFKRAVVGLSGGIDSALVATIAADALGRENVLGVRMPSRYSSRGSLDDAEALARSLGIGLETISVEPMFEAYLGALRGVFADRPPNEAEENLQARIRGALLMAISNKFGHMVLSTGNKSELACGYCTLYGDMSGGLAVISDVPKTTVYEIARWVNRNGAIIPEASLTKPPSAELRPDQTDQDSLPPYDVLDRVLEAYVEDRKTVEEIVAMGVDEVTVRRVKRMVDVNEYKRKQAAPGFRVTRKAFGTGRRIPIARAF